MRVGTPKAAPPDPCTYCMDIDVASARMTKRGGGSSSDYDICARKPTQHHCEWLRPRGVEGCIIQVPLLVVKLRHAKVVVSRQYPRKKPVVTCIRIRIALFGVFFPREDSLGKYRRCVVPDSVAVVVCRSSASSHVGT